MVAAAEEDVVAIVEDRSAEVVVAEASDAEAEVVVVAAVEAVAADSETLSAVAETVVSSPKAATKRSHSTNNSR